MTVLRDLSISQTLQTNPPLATNVDVHDIGRKASQIQPSSLDLTVGKIFVPGTTPDELGGTNNPRDRINLQHGATAVIRTNEVLSLPHDLAAIGFPPSSVSLRGLLMTNPGHVDPGYSGTMSFTVINMGKETYQLKAGDPIVTLLFMKLDAAPTVPYSSLKKPTNNPSSGINEDLLGLLSADFMDIERRSEKKAVEVVRKAEIRIPAFSAAAALLITLIGSLAVAWIEPWKDDAEKLGSELSGLNIDLTRLEARLEALGSDINLGTLEDRLSRIEQEIQSLQE